MMEPGVTYTLQPSPGFVDGRCMGCGQSSTTTIGHMCLVPAQASVPRKRVFKVTIEEMEPYQGYQTTTLPGFETVWISQHWTNS